MKKPQFKKSEMHGDLPFKKGTVASASKIKRKGGEKKENELRKTEYMDQKFGLQSCQDMLDDGSGY